MQYHDDVMVTDAPDGALARAIGALTAGREDAALESFTRLLDGESTPWAMCSARLHLLRGELPAAATRLAQVIAREPGNVEAHVMMGQVHRAALRTIDAAASFRAALRLDPSHRRAAAGLAELFEVQEP